MFPNFFIIIFFLITWSNSSVLGMAPLSFGSVFLLKSSLILSSAGLNWTIDLIIISWLFQRVSTGAMILTNLTGSHEESSWLTLVILSHSSLILSWAGLLLWVLLDSLLQASTPGLRSGIARHSVTTMFRRWSIHPSPSSTSSVSLGMAHNMLAALSEVQTLWILEGRPGISVIALSRCSAMFLEVWQPSVAPQCTKSFSRVQFFKCSEDWGQHSCQNF